MFKKFGEFDSVEELNAAAAAAKKASVLNAKAFITAAMSMSISMLMSKVKMKAQNAIYLSCSSVRRFFC